LTANIAFAKMGSAQSQPASTTEKELLARIQALNVAPKSEDEYVYLNEKGSEHIDRRPDISISIAEEWTQNLLSDPKVISCYINGKWKPNKNFPEPTCP
jgi:hypothetical protein